MMAASPEDIGALIAVVFAGTSVLVLVKAWARKIENQSKVPTARVESAERADAGALPRPDASRRNSP
jgi:hypothetical protein